MTTDKLIRIEKAGRVWRAIYTGPNGDVTICSCSTRSATEINADFIMRTMPSNMWAAFVNRPNVRGAA